MTLQRSIGVLHSFSSLLIDKERMQLDCFKC